MERFGRGEKEVVKGQQVATEHMMAIVFDVRMKEWDPRKTQRQYTHCQPKHGNSQGKQTEIQHFLWCAREDYPISSCFLEKSLLIV